MSDTTAKVTPDPQLRQHAQAFYDAVRTNNIAIMEDMVNKGFPLSWAHAFSPESLPEYALAHKAPDAAWWLLAHDVAPASWSSFATKAGRSFLSYGLDLVIHRSSTVSASVYVRLASRLAREAGGQLPLAASALIERLAIKSGADHIRDEAVKAASDLRSQSADAFTAIKEQGRNVLGDIRQAAQNGLDTPEVKKAVTAVRSWRDRLLDGTAAASLRRTWDEKVAPVFKSASPADESRSATSAQSEDASPATPVSRPLKVHATDAAMGDAFANGGFGDIASKDEVAPKPVIVLPSEFPQTAAEIRDGFLKSAQDYDAAAGKAASRKTAPSKAAAKTAAKPAVKTARKSPAVKSAKSTSTKAAPAKVSPAKIPAARKSAPVHLSDAARRTRKSSPAESSSKPTTKKTRP